MSIEAEDPKAFHQRMWREYGPKQAPPAYSVEERRVRMEIADRLCAIISPDRLAPVDMEWAEAQVRALLKSRQEHSSPDDIRDAALEEAATVDLTGMTEWARGVVRERIRALKSKPAPRGHINGCGMDANHRGLCVASPPIGTKP